MSLGNPKARRAWLKAYRRAQLGTCGTRHGLSSRAQGSKRKDRSKLFKGPNSNHSIDAVDARRQVRQEKRRSAKATRLHNKRVARDEINDSPED